MSLVIQAIESLPSLAAMVLLGYMTYQAYLYYQTLFVQGKPNQWVVVMNKGEQKQAGIGLVTTKMPFDVVATFPAKVNKVNFTTLQTTKEMQGLKVSAMIVWTIFREGDGPTRAYRCLGEDLKNDDPKIANALMNSMVSAIVRNTVANSTLDRMIREREGLRKIIMDSLRGQLKDWGIWIETVEITDVQIMSSKLFKNLQCEFRDDQKSKATTEKLKVDFEIAKKRLEIKAITDKRNQDKHEKKSKADSEIAIKNKEMEHKKILKAYEQQFEKFQIQEKERIDANTRKNTAEIATMERNFKDKQSKTTAEVEKIAKWRIHSEKKNQEVQRVTMKDQELNKAHFQARLARESDQFQLNRTKLASDKYAQQMRQSTLNSVCSEGKNGSTFNYQSTDGSNALIAAIDDMVEHQIGAR